MIDDFMEDVSRLDALGLLERHQIHRTAKLLRRRIEAGMEPSDAEWDELFDREDVRELALIHLSKPADVLNLDFEATWVGAKADSAARQLRAVAREAAAGRAL